MRTPAPIALAAFMAASGPAIAQSQFASHCPAPIPGLPGLIAGAAGSGRNVLIGDPHFGSSLAKLYEMLACNPATFRQAKNSGIDFLAIEYPSDFQPGVDNYRAGRIDRDALKKWFSYDANGFPTRSDWITEKDKNAFLDTLIDTFDNAFSSGMGVILYDDTWQGITALAPEILKRYGAAMEKEVHTSGKQSYLDNFLLKLKPEERQWIVDAEAKFRKSEEYARFDDRTNFYHIQSRMPQGSRALVVAGLRHLEWLDDTAPMAKTMTRLFNTFGHPTISLAFFPDVQTRYEYYEELKTAGVRMSHPVRNTVIYDQQVAYTDGKAVIDLKLPANPLVVRHPNLSPVP